MLIATGSGPPGRRLGCVTNSPITNDDLRITNSTGLFAALQLADSFFPSGMFTQSHGLERFVETGLVGAERLEPLFHSYVLHMAATADALAARWVVRAASAHNYELVEQLDRRLEATKLSSEARTASRRCGGRMLLLGAELFGGALLPEYARRASAGQVPGHQSVALALLAAASGLDEEAAVQVELHTFAVSLVSAAVRLGALDHINGQRLLLGMRPVLAEAAALGAKRHWRDMGGFAPAIELAQFQHRFGEMHMFTS